MIHYKKCIDAEPEKIYAAFSRGFSDYIIKFEMPQEDFFKRFFGPEDNSLEYSYLALDDEEAVGVILSGLKEYEDVRTMRCGTLCVAPEYRGKGISQELFRLHKQTALDNGCKQLFLEVIVGNDRAVKFYNSLGYNKVYDIYYYSLPDTSKLRGLEKSFSNIKQIDFDTLCSISDKMKDIHINWQNGFDYMRKLADMTYYGAYQDAELIGALGINSMGKIFMLWTSPAHRQKGVASSLITRAANDLQAEKLNISITNNSKMEGFLQHHMFVKDKISQYEMYLIL